MADRCKGDIRSAINDLQSICLDKKQIDIQSLGVLGYRDREKIIFDALREIFKTSNIQSIKETMSHLDESPDSILLWLSENLPNEYRDINDLVKGYDALSKADIFLGRTYRRQNYGLWSYACDIMNGGVATAKTHNYPNEKYNFPTWLRELKNSKSNRDTRDSITKKISEACHNSSNKSIDFLLTYFMNIFRNDTDFAVKMTKKFDFTENEMKYLLGEKYSHKIKDILRSSETIVDVKPIEEEVVLPLEEDRKDSKQQSLFDF
jgi:replication factor C large subunit